MSYTTETRALTNNLQSQIYTPNEHRHFCGICNKAFNRRDLRDRHKRRCVKASTRLPVSKRKSCLSCVRSKVRCDLGSPVCSRCRERGKECIYTASTVSKKQPDIVVGEQPGKPQRGIRISTETLETVPIEGHVNMDMGITVDSAFQQLLDEDLYFQTSGAGYITEKDNNITISSDNHTWDIQNSIQDSFSSERWLQNIDLPSEEFMNQPWSTKPTSQDLVLAPKAGTSIPDFSSLIALDSPAPESTETTLTPPPKHHSQPPRLPTATLISILLSIPTAMLQDHTTPHFIHPHLYPCSSPTVDTVPCPVSNAFCFLKAYEAAVSSSLNFMHNVLNTERERLISQFSESSSITETLATVHALCIYQIIGFFDSADPAQVLAAERHNSGFLRIARALVRYCKCEEVGSLGWEEWKVMETVRRTIHVVHAVNVMSMSMVGRKEGYEPLDDAFVGGLPLPCAGEVWRAGSSVEWERAKRKLGEEKVVTVNELIEGGRLTYELMRRYEGDDLVRLILSCVKV